MTPEELRERAAECDRLAQQTVRPQDCERLRHTARRWRDLADEEEPQPGRS
jgi:hypothetical protein